MWVFKGRLPQVEGGLLVKAIEEIIRQQDNNASAESFNKKVRSHELTTEKPSYGQKRSDALSAMAEHFIATATVDSLKEEHKHSPNCDCSDHTPHHIYNQWISQANAKRFSSDASLYTVLEDKFGNVLNVGRKTRTVNTALRRALNLRDRTRQLD